MEGAATNSVCVGRAIAVYSAPLNPAPPSVIPAKAGTQLNAGAAASWVPGQALTPCGVPQDRTPPTKSFPRKREPPFTDPTASNRGPRLRGDDPVVVLSIGTANGWPNELSSARSIQRTKKMHALIRITRSSPTPICHFRQTYLRCFQRAYTGSHPPPTRTDVDGERRGGWTGRRGGIVPPVGSQATAGP